MKEKDTQLINVLGFRCGVDSVAGYLTLKDEGKRKGKQALLAGICEVFIS